MARSRLDLHELLVQTVGSDVPVYFQPPSDIRMKFPCVVYERARADTRFANDLPYANTKRYTVKTISRDPDSPLPDAIATLPMCTHSSFLVFDNLNQDIFDLYF